MCTSSVARIYVNFNENLKLSPTVLMCIPTLCTQAESLGDESERADYVEDMKINTNLFSNSSFSECPDWDTLNGCICSFSSTTSTLLSVLKGRHRFTSSSSSPPQIQQHHIQDHILHKRICIKGTGKKLGGYFNIFYTFFPTALPIALVLYSSP